MTTLYEILCDVKPKRALFTSYTYSSTWFEAGPYPFLRRNDCEQITVMLDAREARHSVDNSTSRFGGSRYRLIGTTPTGGGAGIFHPKIAYLESDDGDVFVVGSGNLTGLGQGQSLEVLDAVSAVTDPMVFGQIADFLEQLPDRLAMLQDDDRQILASFANRARAQMARYAQGAGAQSVWLVTSLRESAGSQFAALAGARLSSPGKLTVLSPFFDPDVSAVIRLRNALQLETVEYGLARSRDALIAPFLENISKPNKPTVFVEPPENHRPLHAKWFEISGKDGDALVMTGSVNATQQSLWNINNIEVSLVRHLSHSTLGDWSKTKETPRYVPCEYPAPLADPDQITLAARITRHYSLEVEFSRMPADREVQLVLHYAEHRVKPVWATLDDKRIAKIAAGEKFVQGLPDAALWITASNDEFEATTWVNVEPQLHAKPAQVDLFKSLSRVEDDAYDEEDAFLLFNAAHMVLTGRHLNSKGKTGRKIEDQQVPGKDLLVTEAEWLAGQGTGTRANAAPSAESVRIFKAIGKLLEMSDAEIARAFSLDGNDGQGHDGDQDSDLDEDDLGDSDDDGGAVTREDRKRERRRQQCREAVAQARQTLQLAIDDRLQRQMPDALAILIVPQKIRNNLRSGMPYSLRHVDEGRETLPGPVPVQLAPFLTGLLPTLAGMGLGPAAVDNLLPMMAAGAALAAVCLERRKLAVDYGRFRAALETIAGHQLNSSDYQTFLQAEWREGRLPRMHRFDLSDLVVQTERIAGAARMEDRIDSAIALALDDPKAKVPHDMQNLEYIVKGLRGPLGRKWKLYSVLVTDTVADRISCPQCYGPLDADEVKKLKSVRMAICSDRCRRPLFLKTGVGTSHTFKREAEAFIFDRRKTDDKGGTAC